MIEEVAHSQKLIWKKKGRRLIYLVPTFIIGVSLLILPNFMSAYGLSFITHVLIFGIFAVSLNLLFGYSGLFSMGHAAFFGVGAYTAGIMSTRFGITKFWIFGGVGAIAAALTAAAFGIIALRSAGIYFLFVTMALGELLSAIAMRWKSMTGGSNGVVGINYPEVILQIKLNSYSYYYLVFLIFLICFFHLSLFIRSPFGQGLQGIRDNENRMKHFGYNTWLYKYAVFIIAGFFAGVAGVLYAPFAGVLVPSVLGTKTSALVMLMVVIGSDRIFAGPILGARVILFLQYYASIFAPQVWPLILGSAFVISVVFLRGGISIYIMRLFKRI